MQRTTLLHYDLETQDCIFAERKRICEILFALKRVWRVNSQQSTSDWKRNAGATSLVGRKEVFIGRSLPPCIETNIDVWGIDAGNIKLYCFPDYLFVLQNERYGAIPYESLTAHCSVDRFIEDSSVPSDANIVGHTWQYVREDGGPDRRFNNNRQLPIALYGLLVLKSSSGLNIYLQCSNQQVAQQAAEEIEQHKPQRPEQAPFHSAPQRPEQPKSQRPEGTESGTNKSEKNQIRL